MRTLKQMLASAVGMLAAATMDESAKRAQPWVYSRNYPRNASGNPMSNARGNSIQTWFCRPGDTHERVNVDGSSYFDLTSPWLHQINSSSGNEDQGYTAPIDRRSHRRPIVVARFA